MLRRKFELIPITFGFLRFFKVAQKMGQNPCTLVHGILSKMTRREFSILLIHVHVYIILINVYVQITNILSYYSHSHSLQEWNMGQRASNTAGVTFEDVVIPNEVSPILYLLPFLY